MYIFISKSSDKIKPFTTMLRRDAKFEWTPDCAKAFREIKEFLAIAPTLSVLEVGETVYVYLATSEDAISFVLVRKIEGKQNPVHYVSRTLSGEEVRYTKIERYILSLVHCSRKLRHFFYAHPVTVVSNVHINLILKNVTAWDI